MSKQRFRFIGSETGGWARAQEQTGPTGKEGP